VILFHLQEDGTEHQIMDTEESKGEELWVLRQQSEGEKSTVRSDKERNRVGGEEVQIGDYD
jgi:hypothetical protein